MPSFDGHNIALTDTCDYKWKWFWHPLLLFLQNVFIDKVDQFLFKIVKFYQAIGLINKENYLFYQINTIQHNAH